MTRTAIESFNYVRDSFDNLVKQFNLTISSVPTFRWASPTGY